MVSADAWDEAAEPGERDAPGGSEVPGERDEPGERALRAQDVLTEQLQQTW